MASKKICPKCNCTLKKVSVEVAGAETKVVSFQCKSCDYFTFEQNSSKNVLEELKDSPLKIRHKIVKLSKDRLGIYFNSNIIRSLNLKKGSEIFLSVPDKNHVVIELQAQNP